MNIIPEPKYKQLKENEPRNAIDLRGIEADDLCVLNDMTNHQLDTHRPDTLHIDCKRVTLTDDSLGIDIEITDMPVFLETMDKIIINGVTYRKEN